MNPAYPSQTCGACGVAERGSRRSQAEFRCVACGHAQNADINADRNILAPGAGATARRGAFTLVTLADLPPPEHALPRGSQSRRETPQIAIEQRLRQHRSASVLRQHQAWPPSSFSQAS